MTMEPTVTALRDRPGVEIADPIENARFALYTPAPVSLVEASSEEFYFPVDTAVAVRVQEIEVPKLTNVLVRTPDGDLVADNADHVDRSFDDDAYTLELTTAPMKLYLSVDGSLDVRHGTTSVTLAFDGQTEVRIGARSFHDQPAGTVTTTPDPVGAMDALSYLGSALKTTSPERSFPTLRGHPPLVEVGESFDAPEGLARPDTGARLELPAEYEYVYPAASLAYYLGANVVPADEPRLVADGFERSLDGALGYERTVGRVLRQTFFFDCLTRTEGYYEVDLHERAAVEPLVDLDFAALYDAPLAERLDAYLSVPFETVADHLPDWNLTTDVLPTAENVAVLPFVAADLALIRCPTNRTASSVAPTPEPIDEFFRNRAGESDKPDESGRRAESVPPTELNRREPAQVPPDDFTRSTTETTDVSPLTEQVFNPDPADTVEHAWVGEGVPLGANKATVESYRRRVDRTAPEKERIDIHVVCNDESMKEEGVVEEFYGVRDLLRFDVSIHYDLTTDELGELLATPADFVHYIGHADAEGLRCPDGHLDARNLDAVNVKAFVLNACRSYEHGQALVEAGSYGGVVTLAEVANSVATETGQTLARLLNCGFPLRVALALAKETISAAYQYVTVGDGGLTLCQSESGAPIYLSVEPLNSCQFDVEFETFSTQMHGLGALHKPNISKVNAQYLTSGVVDTFRLSPDELDDLLALETLPIEVGGELYWSDKVTSSYF